MRLLALVTLLAAVAVSPARAGLPVTTQTLPNGLRLVLSPDSTSASVHVTMCYGVTPFTAPDRPAGIAAVLADLLATEPAMDADLARGLRGWGATFGHSVRPDAMCFETTVAPGALDAVLELERARMRPVEITQERLDAVRATRRAQWAAAASDPVTMGVVELTRSAFRGHAYGRMVGGPDAQDAEATPAMLTEARDACILAANATVVIAGRFDAAEAVKSARARFGDLPRRAVPRVAATPLPKGGERRTVPLVSAGTQILFLGWRCGPAADRDAPALEVLALAIGSGGASLLGRETAGENAIYGHVEARFNASRDASLLSCMVVPRPRADRDGTEQALVDRIEELATAPLPEEDLERAKRQAEARRLFALENPSDRAQALALTWLTTGRADEDEALERIRKVTAADVRRAAAKALVEAQRSAVWIVPAEAPDGERTGP